MTHSYSRDITLSILFIPFDAAIQHYKRNARNGVKACWKNEQGNQDILPPHNSRKRRYSEAVAQLPPQGWQDHTEDWCSRVNIVEPVGAAMTPSEISIYLPSIVESVCLEMQGSVTHSFSTEQQMALKAREASGRDTTALRQRLNHPRRQFPDIIFLSEQPKEVDFPDRIQLPQAGIFYHKLPSHSASRRTQHIVAYVRGDMTSGSCKWYAQTVTKISAQGKEEHMLLVAHQNQWTTCRFIGVHLSSLNTNADPIIQKKEAENLIAFCKNNAIDFAIGDFNMDMKLFNGHTGARTGSTVYLASNAPGAHQMWFQEQYTNSTNEKHYMGHLIINPKKVSIVGMDAEGTYGASGSRSLSGSYYSDHAPIGVSLSFKSE